MMRAAIGAIAVATVLALVGCTSDDEPDPSPTETDSTERSEASVVDIQDDPGSLDDFVGAHEDATIETCESGDSGWVVDGTVTNPTDEPQNYRIYVSVRDDGDTIGLVQVDVSDVAADESASWETEVDVETGDLECLLRVERFSPAA